MPWISKFYGMEMAIDLDAGLKLSTPHFDVYYDNKMARLAIADGSLIEGAIAPVANELANRWREQNKTELMTSWSNVNNGDQEKYHIDPLV